MSDAHAVVTDPTRDNHHHPHSPHLAHHFDTPEQQYASAKLGMWVFLGTEILMFGGLFCAYSVYRHNHPEVFSYAHRALDPVLGGINTAVLIASSLTMALAVRYSQLGKKLPLLICLALTILGGFGFMVIKTIEYKTKWEHHLFPGKYNVFNREFKGDAKPPIDLGHTDDGPAEHMSHPPDTHAPTDMPGQPVAAATTHAAAPTTGPSEHPLRRYYDPLAGTPDEPKIKPGFLEVGGVTPPQELHGHHSITYPELSPLDQERVNSFFSVYFMMTGLHGFHVLVGMGLIGWVLLRANRGEFSPEYFTPVDMVGLYWHLVDLIWIFLFPLLYLIH